MSYELDDEYDEISDELFPEGIERIAENTYREIEVLDEGVVRERIKGETLFEVDELPNSIIGEPKEDMEHWHLQSERMSCAVAVQEFVGEELLDVELSETAMIEKAENMGWYENGTYPEDVGKLLEYLGLEVERQFEGCLEDIQETLENGGKVMASVNNAVLSSPFHFALPGMGANHVVEVIGIDKSDPANIKVILNDPGVANGCGISHSIEVFQKAWETGDCFMVSAFKSSDVE
jgi:hypothetical protein